MTDRQMVFKHQHDNSNSEHTNKNNTYNKIDRFHTTTKNGCLVGSGFVTDPLITGNQCDQNAFIVHN